MRVFILSEKKEEVDYILELVENSSDAELINQIKYVQEKCGGGI